jgi:hypothetical protein
MTLNGKRMIVVAEGLWRTDGGTLAVAKWPVRKDRWRARWTDFLSGEHHLMADTKAELAARLAPYGMRLK